MRCIDLIAAFELEINKIDDSLEKPLTDDTIYWLNQAVVKFVKDRFNGNAPKRTSYEQNEKRTRDLINLLRERVSTFENKQPNRGNPDYRYYEVEYPTDMMFVLNEDVIITDNEKGNAMNTCVFECTADSFMYRITNSLTDFHYRHHRARPLRIRCMIDHNASDGSKYYTQGSRLLVDNNYLIKSYTLGYIKIPEEITNEDPYREYKDFPEYIWPEIIKIAAQMYVENQSDPRYRTLTNEVLTQE